MTEEIQPFSTGTQYMDWQEANCCRCVKYNPEATAPEDGCDIEFWLSLASVGSGTVSTDIARRMNYYGNEGRYQWQCSEMIWTRTAADERAQALGYANFETIKERKPQLVADVRVEGLEAIPTEAERMLALSHEIAPMLPGLEVQR